jgi:hypothetical protein
MREAFDKLWKEGGVARLYKGLGWALFLAPASRFGDTAANTLAIEALRTSAMPVKKDYYCDRFWIRLGLLMVLCFKA